MRHRRLDAQPAPGFDAAGRAVRKVALDDWTEPKILDLAPDAASRKAGQALGRAGAWAAAGQAGRLAWGEIKGSGAAPYLTALSLDGPVFKCSCPSRKFPCKHGLGLFLVLAAGGATAADPPDWVAQWQAKRAAAAAPKPEGETKPVDAKAQDKRRQQRESKVDAGVGELELWMRDLVRRGLASARGEPYAFWDRMGARLVDAQAPGLARRVRELPGRLSGGRDEMAVLALGRLMLLTQGWRRQDALPGPLRAELRAAIGFPVAAEDLALLPGVADHWTVVAQTTEQEESLQVRSTWLCGVGGRIAQVLDFAAGGRPLQAMAVPGQAFRGEVVFHPGAAGLRGAIRTQEAAAAQPLPGVGIAAALDGVAEALARVPWLEEWPMALRGVRFARTGGGWAVVEGGGLLPVADAPSLRPFAAVAGGAEADVFGVWDGRALSVLALGLAGHLYQPSVADPRLVRRAA